MICDLVLGTEIWKCSLVQINRGVATVGFVVWPLQGVGLKGREVNVVSEKI